MASPFSTFRKNQKIWMVALTILTMFAFVFLGQAKMGGPGGSQTDPDVFTWKYGTVKQSDINNRMYQRKKVQEFLYRSGKAADMPEQQLLQVLQTRFPVSEPRVIESILLAKKAQQMGIDISDDMVRRFIRGWTQDKVTRDDLAKIMRDLSGDRGGISQSQLFDGLRVELAAMYAQDLFSPLLVRGGQGYAWFRGDTPAERWDYFTRLNRKVTAEMMPVSVKDFVDKVPEPSASELQSFYDQYKNDYPESTSPTPGFKQPYKVQFEYVKADNTKLLEETLGTVTEDEIQKYYDRYKDDFFKKSTLPDSPEKTDQEKADDTKSGDSATKKDDAAATDKPSDGKADSKAGEKPADLKGGAKTDASKSGANSADAKSTSKSDAKSSGSKSGGAKSDSKAPSSKAGDAKSGDGKKSTDGKQSSDSPRGSSSLNGELLALADDAEILVAQKSDAAVKGDSKSAAKSDPKTNSSTGAKTDMKATDAKADVKAPDTKAVDAKAGETKAADSTTAGTPATQRPVEYEPFDKVSGMIRNRIAQQKVDEKVAAAFRSIQAQMERYKSNLDTYRALKSQGNTAAKEPQPPDLEALAKPFGFDVKKTELVSLQQVYDGYDIGKSHQPVVAGNYTSPPFYQIAYQMGADGQPRVKLYQTDESEDAENNHYLWWKIADQAANIPPLDAIKSDVVTAWKIVQARKPALATAKEDVAQVQKSKQTLQEAFGNAPGVEVLSEGPFSWLTRTADQGLRLSTLKGVENVGNDFMKDVFALKQGETGVAANDPQTEYYVVQIKDEEPSTDALHQSFMTAMSDPMNSLVYAAVAANDHRNAPAAWFKELADQYDFKMSPGHTFSQTQEID
jgi:hypothetical protein